MNKTITVKHAQDIEVENRIKPNVLRTFRNERGADSTAVYGIIKSMKIQKSQFYVKIFLLLSAMCLISACDTENLLNIDEETLEIVEILADTQMLNIGDTTTITAIVDYSGDASDLDYVWSVGDGSEGRIVGSGNSVVYVASESTGTNTIHLEVTDGNLTKRDNIRIEVGIGHAIVAMPNRYWQGNTFTQTLSFRLQVDEIFRENIKLRYEILQDTARAGAFLSIAINDTSVVQNRSIGAVQPNEPQMIGDEVDVSSVITAPGNYELSLTLEIVNVMEDAWLLRKLTFIGVEGTLSEIR